MTTPNRHQTVLESPEALVDEDMDPRLGAYFPRRYLTDFFEFLADHDDRFEVLTYADLPWGDDCDYENNYPKERSNWERQLESGERDPNKVYVILQYDIDSRPERAMKLLREPAHAHAPANVMIFNRRVNRRKLDNKGILKLTDYDLDTALLQELESERFVVGYHMNAYERSQFNLDRALEIFDEDIKELSQLYAIRFFSAHGGIPDDQGRNNRDMPFHPDWVSKLKWVHNGHVLRVDGHFSDGGHNSPKRDPANRDLRAFVSSMIPGNRYSILLHPQYYDTSPKPSPRFTGTPWYDELMATYHRSETNPLWADVRPPARGRGARKYMQFRNYARALARRWF